MAYPPTAPTGPDDTSGGLIARAVGTDPQTYEWVPANSEQVPLGTTFAARLGLLENTVPAFAETQSSNFTVTPTIARSVTEYPIDASADSITIKVIGGAENCTLVFRDEAGVCSVVRTITISALIEGADTEVEINTQYGWSRLVWKGETYGYKMEHSH